MARNRIAGITIEIGGDATPLQKALQGVNKSLGTTQASLKDVNKLLKLDPKNTNLLKQKQEYLAKAVDDTKEKLDKEKQALAELKKKSTTDDVTEEQKALEREIADTENQLKDLTKQYKKFGSVGSQKLQAVGKDVKAVGKKMTSVGVGITKYVTAPIVGIGAAAGVAWKEVDSAMDTLVKKTGASGDALEDMEEIVKDIATSMPTSFETAAEAVGEVNTRFGVTGDELDDLSQKFIKFADLNDKDVSSSIDSVQSALAAFGLGAEDAGGMLDTLNAVAQNTGTDVDTLTAAMVAAAPQLQDMGMTAADAAVFIGDLSKSGLDTNAVMSGMKKAFAKAAKEGKTMDEAMQEMQASIAGAGSETEATQIAMDLFGKNAGPAIANAVREGKLSFDEMGLSLTDFGGNVESTFEAVQDPTDQFNQALNQVKLIGADLAETAMPLIAEALGVVRDVLEKVSEKWNALSEDQKGMIVKFGLLAAAIGPVVTTLGGVVSGAGSVISGFGKLSGTIGAAGSAGGLIGRVGGLITSFGPLLAGGAVVAGVVAGGVLIYKNWDKIKAGAKKVAEVVGAKWDELKTNVTAAAKKVHDDVKDKFEKVRDKATTAFETLRANVTSKFETARDAVVSAVGTLHDTATEKFEAAKTALTNAAETIRRNVSEKFEEAKTKAATAIEKLKSEASDKLDTAKTNLTNAAENIRRTVADKFEEAKTKAATAVEKLKNEATTKFETAKTNITTKAGNIFDTVKSKFEDAKDKATTAFETLKNNVKSNMCDAATNAENGGKTVYNAISTKFEEARKIAAQKIADIVKPDDIKFKNMKTRIHNAMGPVIAKVKDRFEQVRKKAAEKVDAIKDKFNNIKLTLPKPKLPSISLDWGYVDVFGKEMKYPKGFKVSWNRRAYENPLMFTRPTVLATPYGLQGFGDGPGGEIVLGERKLREIVGAAGDTNYYITVNGAAGQNVNELADAVQRRLIALQNQRRAAGLA